jgi:hypothetical protein
VCKGRIVEGGQSRPEELRCAAEDPVDAVGLGGGRWRRS